MWYYLRGKVIYIFLFIYRVLGFPISRMLYLLFPKKQKWEKYNTETSKTKKKMGKVQYKNT